MEVVVDSTVQEKNVTYPLDTKQYRKIINGAQSPLASARCLSLAPILAQR